MRVSEKTIELNFCAEVTAFMRPAVKFRWFGLTQAQEAEKGFDASAQMNGRVLIFQFKASNHVLKNGHRKFKAQHHQMVSLRELAKTNINSVFYILPKFGTHDELALIDDLLDEFVAVNLNGFPQSIAAPNRKSNCHNMYLFEDAIKNPRVNVRSQPFTVEEPLPVQKLLLRLRGEPKYSLTFEGLQDTRQLDVLDKLRVTYNVDLDNVGLDPRIFLGEGRLKKLLGSNRRGMFALSISR